jgi:hypothetical protein
MPDDQERPDWRISSILREAAEGFEKQARMVEGLLKNAQDKFKRDYTGTTAAVGILLIGASTYLALSGKVETFATAGLVSGALILVAAVIMRHRSAESQVRNGEKLLVLEQERARFTQRSFVAQQIWLHGLPEGTPLAQIQILLGDRPSTDSDSHGLTWKKLPVSDTTSSSTTADAKPEV